jgi:hypothetical protein
VRDQIAVESFPARLDPGLPVGFHVQVAAEIEPGTPSLQQAVVSCTWRIDVVNSEHGGAIDAADLAERAERLLAADELIATRERKGQQVTDDLRPAILGLEADGGTLVAELATQPRGLRPSELVRLLGDDVLDGRGCRIHQWTMSDGALREPLPLASLATSAPHAEARA